MKIILITLIISTFSTTLFATVEKKQLQLHIEAQYGTHDYTTVYFDYGVSPAYSQTEDELKYMSSFAGVPNIYSLTSDNIKCSINGYSPLTQSAVIGIGLLLDSTAQYAFTLQQFSNFDSSTLVILEDRLLHVFTEMQVNFYQVQLTPADTTGRFFLHVTRSVQFSQQAAGCSNNNGILSVSADSAVAWNSVNLMDTNGTLIRALNNVQGQFAFSGLPEGLYNVNLNYNNYSVTKTAFVAGNYIVASISASSNNAQVDENVDFTSNATNTTEYVWSFGDSTIETGVANPTYAYLAPGTYTVTLICSNSYGCSAEVETNITVTGTTAINTVTPKGISIINLGAKTVEVLMNDVALSTAELDVYNILGQAVYVSPITDKQMEVSLTNQPAGIYLISVKNAGKSITSKMYIN